MVFEVVCVRVIVQVNHPGQVSSVQATKADGSIQQKKDQRHFRSQVLTDPWVGHSPLRASLTFSSRMPTYPDLT